MKYVLIITFLLIATLIFGQSKTEQDPLNTNPNYDRKLAGKLGGDDYGMK
jgi:hypothetical protein